MIAIIDYNSGNTASVANALRRLGQRYEITGDPELVARADKIIFPGVGAAKAAMKELKKRGLDKLLRRTKPPSSEFVWDCSFSLNFRRKIIRNALALSRGG